MNIFKNNKAMIPGDSYNAAVDKNHTRNTKRLEQKELRQRKIDDCAAVLRDCRFTFRKTIAVENALANEMRLNGFSTSKQYNRVRDAAIGILVVEQALYELQSINSESELNNAMNSMGMALRQLHRVDNSGAAVSSSTERLVRQWYPEGLSTDTADKAIDAAAEALAEIPDEFYAIIDDAFVQNLMQGDSFEMAMAKRNMVPKIDPTAANRNERMEEIRRTMQAKEPDSTDSVSILNQHSNKY